MRNLLLFTAFLFFVPKTWANSKLLKKDCLHERNKICHKILKLSSHINHEDAYQLSNIFSAVSKKYDLDPKLLVSIAFQESSFNPKAVRLVKGLVKDEENQTYQSVEVGSDFCMMQIHVSNIKKMELDVVKLLNDTTYCIEAGAKILANYKKNVSENDEQWWTLYNAKSLAKRKVYYHKISRHLNKIQTTKLRDLASDKKTSTVAY